MMKTMIIAVVLLGVAVGGCTFDPDDGYIQGSASCLYPGPGSKVHAYKQDLIDGASLMGGAALGKAENDMYPFLMTVPGDASYYVYYICDLNSNRRFDKGVDFVRGYKRNPVYVPANETAHDVVL